MASKDYLVRSFQKDVVYKIEYGIGGGEGDLVERGDRVEVVKGFVDWVVLGKCGMIVHSFGSSFGEEAAVVGLRDSLRIRKGGNIVGVDTSREFCGNPQVEVDFVKRNTAEGDKEGLLRCYVDGRGREVCSPKLRKRKCGEFTDKWGVEDAYC
ncbi:hypothetical protein TrCOL_g5200 [Triparma columacea]|uniref:Uncharacterized protein n=1 Tax=Triparma columacea TaxID=722753 RepID=A0A9W7LG82_9STRA|nr:hypothetical protein TrCOL_g5200 [Triparma columacea]